MSMQDPISDMITRIRNGQYANKILVSMFYSKFKLAISKILKKEGYIIDFNINNSNNALLDIKLKYFKGQPVIERIIRVSKPSLRVYRSKSNLPLVMEGLGIAIISTSFGLMTDKEARKKQIGGEVICYVS